MPLSACVELMTTGAVPLCTANVAAGSTPHVDGRSGVFA
jgi:hypothetical protein